MSNQYVVDPMPEEDNVNTKLFFVTKKDTIEQITTYMVRAEDAEGADALVSAGIYMEESAPETIDTINSITISIGEVNAKGQGQQR